MIGGNLHGWVPDYRVSTNRIALNSRSQEDPVGVAR
jgi:hypothetical protein